MRPTFEVKIFSPFETYYQGQAYSLSANNASGPFDVLAGHANFICLLLPGPVRIDTPYGQREYNLTRGIVRVNQSKVTLFANV
ncbi:F0F1 ATP synthase subunit epsilon [Candidatus Saccharibacteria bacterium]|nr:F0F1 ATP synthase subunit epsilon [Candidatus Saccharibacteria bacterium]